MKHHTGRLKTGVPGLDDILAGGLIPERLYLIDGNPGSGKTTFALQFLLEGVRRGEKCLYVTLSETRVELEDGAASHGWSLEGVDIVELVPDQQPELQGDGQLTMIHPSDVELSETMAKILAAIEARAGKEGVQQFLQIRNAGIVGAASTVLPGTVQARSRQPEQR